MKILIEKMKNLRWKKVECIIGTTVMALVMIGFPISMLFVLDPAAWAEPFVIGFVIFVSFCFGAVGFFCFLDPYLLYRKLPEIQAEADDEFLYIHAKKEAKIPLSEINEISVRFELPNIYQKEFLREFLIHLFSEEYGKVILEIPGFGTYKMYFVPHAKEASDKLFYFLQDVMNRA